MKKCLTALVLFISTAISGEPGFSTAQGSLLFRPMAANTFEPRLGVLWHADNNRLRLDIGNSVDLVQYTLESGNGRLTAGADFFTYTLLRGEKNFHFPVDAVDYLFGLSVNFSDSNAFGLWSSRLRLSHISAHFVDGHYDGTNGRWKDGMNPRVYSREFFDWAISLDATPSIRGYIGVIYLWHVDPTTVTKFSGYAGAEYHRPIVLTVDGFTAYQYTVSGLRPRHEFQAGIKFGPWSGRGTKLFFIFHSGNSIHGEYFDRSDDFSGIGFTVDF